jgi:gluconate 5-dehydrogenase
MESNSTQTSHSILNPAFDLSGCNILVTGAGRGIGRYLTEQLARLGGMVFVNDYHHSRASEVAELLQSQGLHARAMSADIADVPQVKRMFGEIHEQCGGVDIFVNSAGFAQRVPLLDATEVYWDQMQDVNLKGPFFCLQAAAKQMLARHGGRIILLGSVGGQSAQKNLAAYGAAKAGLSMLAKSAAVDLAPHGITVNVVAPGAVEGPWNDQFFSDPEFRSRWEKTVPAGRMATNEDVAVAVLFFASPAAGYITGQTLYVDGGKLAYLPSVPGTNDTTRTTQAGAP